MNWQLLRNVKFEEYKALWGHKVYWTLFVKP